MPTTAAADRADRCHFSRCASNTATRRASSRCSLLHHVFDLFGEVFDVRLGTTPGAGNSAACCRAQATTSCWYSVVIDIQSFEK
ncbi:MAG: hypothetical protein MZV65_36675 [Chromatiales bacterium]|nr:hypothetical protein [Chromatiales bacterium]